MSLHVFIDESRRGGTYLLAAALLRPSELDQTRGLMRGLRVRGERRIHFTHERDSIQKDIAATLVAAQLRTRVYLGQGAPEVVRQRLLRTAVTDLAAGLQRLVLDSRGRTGDQLDRRVIHSTLASAGVDSSTVAYEHLRSHEDPILWVADAVAWCYGAGGQWRRRISPVVEAVTDLGCVSRSRRR